MTGLERCLATLNGGVPDRMPVIAQDAHMAARLSGVNFIDWAFDPQKRAKMFIEQRDRFDLDGCLIGGDTTVLAEAAGAKVAFSEDACPKWLSGCMDDYDRVGDLEKLDPYKSGRLGVWVETVRLVAEAIGKEYLVVGRGDQGAFVMAAMMRGMQEFLIDCALAKEDEALRAKIHKLLLYCNDCQHVLIGALIKAGAHMTSTGDSLAGPSVCSPDFYFEYCQPYEKRTAKFCAERGAKFSIHICGSAEAILDRWMEVGMDMIEIDHKTQFEPALLAAQKNNCTVLGNLDTTMMLMEDAQDVLNAARNLIAKNPSGRNMILSSGCILSPDTPPANLHALVQAAKETNYL
ncbi:MAG: hypothetical protein LBL45_09595 [Treponema sp.]|jgi:uroporphyrinogen decarboxylase|nr:hypothetical protein [Treponema sp.]